MIRRNAAAGAGAIAVLLAYACVAPPFPAGQSQQIAMSESGGAIAFLNSEARVQLCHAQAHKRVTLSVATMSFADSNTYYSWCIPEYHDDQRFHDGNAASEDYGPIAHTFANPKLSTLNDHTMFDHAYINVAIVDVESGPLPDPYGKLGLEQASNCLYLMHH